MVKTGHTPSGNPGRANILQRFRRDRRGSTAVEFAFVIVPFLGLLLAILETAFVFYATEAMESSVTDSARQIMTGLAQSTASIHTSSDFKTQVLCPKLSTFSFIDCSQVVVDVAHSPAAGFSGVDLSKTDLSGQYCPGNPGDIVVVRALYPMPVYFSILTMVDWNHLGGAVTTNTSGQTTYGNGLKHLLMGAAVFRSEPFPVSSIANPPNPGC